MKKTIKNGSSVKTLNIIKAFALKPRVSSHIEKMVIGSIVISSIDIVVTIVFEINKLLVDTGKVNVRYPSFPNMLFLKRCIRIIKLATKETIIRIKLTSAIIIANL